MITQVRPSEMSAWLLASSGRGTPLILDVREASELKLASVAADGFELLHIPMGTVPVRLQELDPEQAIACLCHHGGRSMQVAAFLQARGFRHLANIAGGIDAWSTELDSTVPRY
jgi:rhodanese-related sulfurtransferase